MQALLVDDNSVNRMVLSRALQSVGMVAQAVQSGQEALDWLEARALSGPACDVVILDAQMPHMDGFDLARRISALPNADRLPMVMLSSSGLKGDAQRSRDLGIAAYASKPVSRQELMQVLARVVRPDRSSVQALVTRHSFKDVQAKFDVLLVEDHVVNQKLAIALLERWGHKVAVAGDGAQALKMLARHRFDVVLMDMLMPVMDGLETTRRIRASEAAGQHLPIIAMTASAMESDRDMCLAAGMDDYLSKPIRAPELQALLQRVASRSGGQLVATPAATPAAAASGFDYARGMRGADQEVLDIIAQAFLDQWPHDIHKMRDALAHGDLQSVLHTSHALKGTLAMFGAAPARDLAQRIETLCARGAPDEVLALLDPFATEVQHLLQSVQAQLAPDRMN
jgi:CheY-like chemotaxis protein/HPt (histidine-containing phosphotransfer) domain-containing protein